VNLKKEIYSLLNVMERKLILLLALVFLHVFAFSQQPMKVLVFSKTEGGYRHASIEAGKQMFISMATHRNFTVDTTEDAARFNDSSLNRYDVVVFLSTRGNVLDTFQQRAFQRFIRKGKGFVGIHAATTTEYSWPWYNKLIGAYFDGHPEPQEALYRKVDSRFPGIRHFPDSLTWMDEVYDFRSLQDSLNYVITVDENTYTGGKMGGFHPVSWYHVFENARVFYIGLGHFDAAYTNSMFVNIIYNSLVWCAKKEQ